MKQISRHSLKGTECLLKRDVTDCLGCCLVIRSKLTGSDSGSEGIQAIMTVQAGERNDDVTDSGL